ncbi:hypothetical protein N1027_10500 [Herbiconiux sp. CPCC 205763]|uniref:Uncharacterized protein n=1 Tax=Herbiconiux aconitum TaxID=2970913 RepID=A0ABT2GQW6_9MICO|nr:hypothetical protein [Herbiconiux aconitum]MCS5718563.1 hypothetical protein [Herbiconiux aconitum]
MNSKAEEICRKLVPVDSAHSALSGAVSSTQSGVVGLITGFDPSNADPNVDSMRNSDIFVAICIVSGDTVAAGIPSGAEYLAIYETAISGGDASGEVAYW